MFDKTGTLTAGKPHVVDVHPQAEGLLAGDVLALAAAVEAHSEHPIAAAILGMARQQQAAAEQQGKPWASDNSSGGSSGGVLAGTVPLLQVRDVEVTVGQGISGWVQLPQPGHLTSAAGKYGSGSGLSSTAVLAVQAAAASPRVVEHAGSSGAGVADTSSGTSTPLAAFGRRASLSSLLAAAASQPGTPTQHGSSAASPAPPAKLAAPASEVHVILGNKRQMAAVGVAVPPAAEAYMRGQESKGSTCVLVAVHQALVGVIAVMDPIKPEARWVGGWVVGSKVKCSVEIVALLVGGWREERLWREVCKGLCAATTAA